MYLDDTLTQDELAEAAREQRASAEQERRAPGLLLFRDACKFLGVRTYIDGDPRDFRD